MTNQERLMNTLKTRIAQCESVMTKFQEKFVVSPVEALVWSTQVFDATAEVQEYKSLLTVLKNNSYLGTFEDFMKGMHSNYRGRVVRNAMNPPRSSSPSANLMEESRGVANAKMMELVEAFLPGETK